MYHLVRASLTAALVLAAPCAAYAEDVSGENLAETVTSNEQLSEPEKAVEITPEQSQGTENPDDNTTADVQQGNPETEPSSDESGATTDDTGLSSGVDSEGAEQDECPEQEPTSSDDTACVTPTEDDAEVVSDDTETMPSDSEEPHEVAPAQSNGEEASQQPAAQDSPSVDERQEVSAAERTARASASRDEAAASATATAPTRASEAPASSTTPPDTTPKAEQLIPNGRYILRLGAGGNMILDTSIATLKNGTNVIQAAYRGGLAQSWFIAFQKAKGFYNIYRKTADGTIFFLSLPGLKSNAALWQRTSSKAQLWDITRYGSCFRLVSALRPDSVLEVSTTKVKGGNNVVLAAKKTNAAEQRVYPYNASPKVEKSERVVDDGAYEMEATIKSGKGNVATVAGDPFTSGTAVQTAKNEKTLDQRFYLEYQKGGYYKVFAVGSGLALGVESRSVIANANVVMSTNSNSDKTQRWVLSKGTDGTYVFVNMATGLSLTLAGSSAKAGTGFTVLDKSAAVRKQFKLTSCDMLPTGLFEIMPLKARSRRFNVVNGSTASGAGLQIASTNKSFAQKYEIVRVGKDQYRLRTAASGGWVTANGLGNQVVQKGNHATKVSGANVWKSVWKNGHMVLVNKGTGAALSLKGNKLANNTQLVTSAVTGNSAQQFTFVPTTLLTEDCYRLKSGLDTYLGVGGDSKANGANVQAQSLSGYPGQCFYLQRKSTSYRLKNAHSGNYLTALGASSNMNVVLRTSSTSTAQLWEPCIADGGRVGLRNVATGKMLAISGNSTANGANVVTANATGSAGQSWGVTKATYQPYSGYVLRAVNAANANHSFTSHLIVVDRDNCRVIAMRGGNGNWMPERNMPCSVGAPATPTITGSYTVGSRGYSFGSGYTCYYWTQIWNDYLFHSVLYNEGTRTIQDGRLGYHISHGCVRMDINDAHWIYSNIPSGTRVIIY